MKEIKTQEKVVVTNCWNALHPANLLTSAEHHVHETMTVSVDDIPLQASDLPKPTGSTASENVSCKSPDELIERVAKEHKLNKEQTVAFRIIAAKFIEFITHLKMGTEGSVEPLCMLMTGPGGTGKTHVICALTTLMGYYSCAHWIRYLAYTGSAASLIDGMTMHSGLGIQILLRDKGKGSRVPSKSTKDLDPNKQSQMIRASVRVEGCTGSSAG